VQAHDYHGDAGVQNQTVTSYLQPSSLSHPQSSTRRISEPQRPDLHKHIPLQAMRSNLEWADFGTLPEAHVRTSITHYAPDRLCASAYDRPPAHLPSFYCNLMPGTLHTGSRLRLNMAVEWTGVLSVYLAAQCIHSILTAHGTPSQSRRTKASHVRVRRTTLRHRFSLLRLFPRGKLICWQMRWMVLEYQVEHSGVNLGESRTVSHRMHMAAIWVWWRI
jgi:hypothetical protein